MQTEKLNNALAFSLRPLAIILFLSLLSISSLSIVAVVNHMDVSTFIASFSTPKITVAELQQGKIKPVIFIDVRSPEEYAEDRIGESPLIPITDIQAEFGVKAVQKLAKNSIKPNQPQPTIVLYCHSGPRSIKAYKELEKTGLNFAVLSGGITAWRKAIAPEQDARILAPITLSQKQAVFSGVGRILSPQP